MAAPSLSSHLQNMLQRAVQTVKWTYTIYWKLCPLQRILLWSEGYYNGEIKTRKTVHLKEVSAEEASLHRSQQLRELYETLCAAETNHQTRRPSAALSPEDLTESEWFYLLCFSYYFPPAVGLPGRAYARRQYVWLTGANEVDSHIFSRAILAKSAEIQTVVCIPLLDGVVELGTTQKVREDLEFIQGIINIFIQSQESKPPKPALSEHSTSNPPPVSGFWPSSTGINASPAAYITTSPQIADTHNQTEHVHEEKGGDEDVDSSGDSDHTRSLNDVIQNPKSVQQSQTQPNDLMQLDDGSNDDMDSDYHILQTTSQIGNQDTTPLEETECFRRWESGEEDTQFHISHFPLSPPGISSFNELAQEDTHYSQMVSIILQSQTNRCSSISSATSYIHHSPHSAFFKWSSSGCSAFDHLISGPSSQRQLKYIISTVPFLHSKDSGERSQKPSTLNAASRFPKDGTSQEVLIGGANHVLAERRRREKLNERFIILRSLLPFVAKTDKASILGDTIQYVKQLRKKIQELEARVKQIEGSKEDTNQVIKEQKDSSGGEQSMIKKKIRLIDRESGKGKLNVATGNEEAVHVEVSIIENLALVELQCRHRDGLLLDIMQMLKQLRVEITAVQSSVSKGVFTAELRAKVKENLYGKKVTIMEVKKAILQTVSPQ